MSDAEQKVLLAKPRWDGRRVLFQINAGGACVPCAISRDALHGLGNHRPYAPADMVRCFLAYRERIEAIAAGIYRIRPESISGIISIWAGDIDDPPAAPTIASQMQ
jgi:uncharacterized protein DUF1488